MESTLAWLRLYIAELDKLVAVSDGPARAGAMSEVHAVRTVLFSLESGQYLIDLADGATTAHQG